MTTSALRRLVALAAMILVPRVAAAQVVPGGGGTDWDRARSTFTQDMLRDYNALMESWRAALSRGDLGSITRLYAEGASLALPDTTFVTGLSAIEKAWKERLPEVQEVRTGLTDFAASERMVYAMGPFWLNFRDRAGAPQTLIGTYVTVAVRDKGGWRIRSQVLQTEGSGS